LLPWIEPYSIVGLFIYLQLHCIGFIVVVIYLGLDYLLYTITVIYIVSCYLFIYLFPCVWLHFACYIAVFDYALPLHDVYIYCTTLPHVTVVVTFGYSPCSRCWHLLPVVVRYVGYLGYSPRCCLFVLTHCPLRLLPYGSLLLLHLFVITVTFTPLPLLLLVVVVTLFVFDYLTVTFTFTLLYYVAHCWLPYYCPYSTVAHITFGFRTPHYISILLVDYITLLFIAIIGYLVIWLLQVIPTYLVVLLLQLLHLLLHLLIPYLFRCYLLLLVVIYLYWLLFFIIVHYLFPIGYLDSHIIVIYLVPFTLLPLGYLHCIVFIYCCIWFVFIYLFIYLLLYIYITF